MFPLQLHNYFEIAAFLTSILLWSKIRYAKICWLMPFLAFIVAVELTGRYIGRELKQPNYWLYNFSIPIEYFFYLFLFYLHFKGKKAILIAKWGLILFPCFVMMNLLFIEGTKQFNSNFLKVGSFCMLIFSCMYFLEFIKSDLSINPLLHSMFWITTGVFLFSAGEFVYTALSGILFKDWLKWKSLIRDINNSLIYILYACIILGILSFAWNKDQRT